MPGGGETAGSCWAQNSVGVVESNKCLVCLYIYKYMISIYYTLPTTNSSPLRIDGWNTRFLLGWSIFRDHVSFSFGSMLISRGVTEDHFQHPAMNNHQKRGFPFKSSLREFSSPTLP